MLDVREIDVLHGDLQTLWSVSFEVREAEIVAVIGSNGAGKTTILKTLSGLLRPAKGTIHFNGIRLDRLPAERRVALGICLVPEGRGLFSGLTVSENLELGAFNPAARKKRKETLLDVYALFPILEKRKKQLAGTLSGGEQQMVAIGRGLMAKPKLLLLDEPSLGLAPMVAKSIFGAVKRVNELGVTIVLVEQNVRISLEMANRAYVVENGGIVADGEARALLHDERVRNAYLGIEKE